MDDFSRGFIGSVRRQIDGTPKPFTLRHIPFSVHEVVPESLFEVMEGTELITFRDDILRRMHVELKAYVVALQHEEVKSVSEKHTLKVTAEATLTVPATWWDAFKYHAITVSGNPFFRMDKIRWKTVVAEKTEEETVQLVTKAISADLHPDRKVVLPHEQWGKPIQVFIDPISHIVKEKP